MRRSFFMPPLYQQRAELIEANTDLTMRWLALLTPEHQRNVIDSMVRNYTLPQLKMMNAHVSEQVAKTEAKQTHDSAFTLKADGTLIDNRVTSTTPDLF